jgi:hypothetical protein
VVGELSTGSQERVVRLDLLEEGEADREVLLVGEMRADVHQFLMIFV